MTTKNTDEPVECPRCGNHYTHQKNCPNKDNGKLENRENWQEDPRKQDPEIRELLNTEAPDQ